MSMRQNLFVGIRGKTYGRVTAPRSPGKDPSGKDSKTSGLIGAGGSHVSEALAD